MYQRIPTLTSMRNQGQMVVEQLVVQRDEWLLDAAPPNAGQLDVGPLDELRLVE